MIFSACMKNHDSWSTSFVKHLLKASDSRTMLNRMFPHNPQINPIYKSGRKDKAVLLLHGFTGTPDHMRHLANHFSRLGWTVAAPLLAGHGSTPEHLNKTGWQDWYHTAETAFLELKEKHGEVYVCGLSMGGLLTLKLAKNHGQNIKAIASLAAPLFLEKWVHLALPLITLSPIGLFYKYQPKGEPDIKDPQARKNFWSTSSLPVSGVKSITKLQKQLGKDLPKITTPTLLIHSRYDSTAPYESMHAIAQKLSSQITETVTLENSYHVITIDYEKELVTEKVGAFFEKIASQNKAA